MKRKSFISLLLTTSLILCSCTGISSNSQDSNGSGKSSTTAESSDFSDASYTSSSEESKNQQENIEQEAINQESITSDRNFLFGSGEKIYYNEDLVPSVPHYTVAEDLSNVYVNENFESIFSGEYEAYAQYKEKLLENYFVVDDGEHTEFYDIYETNRYLMAPSFVTVDSLMHTYHLYFAYLMKKTEKNYLSQSLKTLSTNMYESSLKQYNTLKGTDWENAAANNVAFFEVALKLLDEDSSVSSDSSIETIVQTETERINSAEGIEESLITGVNEDYSQFKVRGYYEEEEELQGYFKAMMWYGRVAFKADDEDLCRSSLLINLAIYENGETDWENIYRVTSFFAGASDDCGYYEFLPAIETAYGTIPAVDDLPGNDSEFNNFCALISKMDAPRINSIAINDGDSNVIISYRFMGQRFTIDEAIFQNLMYQNVKENSDGDKRLLPDALDVAATLGSETAYDILKDQGDTDYEGYDENLSAMQNEFNNSDQTLWYASLYSNWLNTLRPLLEKKGDGYPTYMTTSEWSKKNLETFEGSYTELKHDTILYGKQSMAEMGGGDIETLDDKGYVDPQPVVYSRFINLANNTKDGLDTLGMLDSEDKDNLQLLSDMAQQLLTISEKELICENLTDDEYEFIRNYGGNLEHFWHTVNEDSVEELIYSEQAPCPVIADIATDPNGSVLEVGSGYANNIYVVVPVEGELRICRGSVYSFYQFEQPISERLTDSEWRNKISSYYLDDNYNYVENDDIQLQPEWTRSYRAVANWE
ncbi:MAG: DUF3160 domain-containing protein [Butyrivibrio sp.]|nr:DUF3160 domain-containing protein [Butyrivibrio sp.]